MRAVEEIERPRQVGPGGAGDLETAFGLFHPDIVINEGEGLPYAGEHVGMAGFQNLLPKIFEPGSAAPILN